MTVTTETTDFSANTSTTAGMLAGDTLYGRIGTNSDLDWIAVNLVAGQTYSIAAIGVGNDPIMDPILHLYSSAGAELDFDSGDDDRLPNLNAMIQFTVVQTGSYFIEAANLNHTAGDYAVTLAQGSRPAMDLPLIAGIIADHSSLWGSPAITYGFRTVGDLDVRAGFSGFDAGQQGTIAAILAYYSEIIGVTFSQNTGASADTAAMLFGNYSEDDNAAAFAYAPITGQISTGAADRAGDVWTNLFYDEPTSFGYGSVFYETMLHEIGHTLGLSHPGLYDALQAGIITYANSAQFVQDSEEFTIMSYFSADTTGASDLNGDTMAVADVLALQNLYGANMATRAGNTVYGFGATAGDIYNFAINIDPKLTIWDGGGTDLLDASGSNLAQIIDLRAGAISSLLGFVRNVAIAVGAVIENATGGGGNDLITGNDADNTLTGGAGRDTLIGGAGDDSFYVDAANDIITEAVSGGYDTVYSSANYTLAEGAAIQALRAVGTAGLALAGNEYSNHIYSGAGADTLTGGGGGDTFVFANIGDSDPAGRDRITDFAAGDHLDLRGIDADTGLASDQAFGALGTLAGAHLLWTTISGSDLILRGDVNGDTTADFELLLKNFTALSVSDILL